MTIATVNFNCVHLLIILGLSPVASPVSANMGEVADTRLQPDISLTANQVGDALVRVQHQNLSDSLSGWHKTFKPTKGVEFRSQGSPTPGINPVEPQPPALPEPELLPSPDELLQPPTSPPTTAPPLLPDNIPGTITVERFEVIGSTVFSPEELAAVTAPFSQRPIAFTELLQVQDAIAELYIQRGYITSGAFIPPQGLNNGVVTIEVIEGEVERIEVNGTKRLNSNYVRSRLARATQTPLQVNQLVETLQLLQLNPLIENLSAELAAGSKTGTSVLRVAVEEAPSFSAILRVDNGRSPTVGTVRRHVTLEEGNLFGFGDSFILGYTNTDGSNSLDEASYTIPINPRNSTFKLSYSRSSSHVIEAPFNQVDIESNARDYQITEKLGIKPCPLGRLCFRISLEERVLNLYKNPKPRGIAP
ncbi:ShlB/FhaC/HecB family hemolysin secretion/activation protein [Coleofasciculus chthonoplastes]|uniref:ShlB/FhaC/HecB family hemolysin secretion/activation protein n=1 Tax=Coleofasciculus chthonoplastes TaxID=64178 RepID=UPI0032F95D5F